MKVAPATFVVSTMMTIGDANVATIAIRVIANVKKKN
jgi:hypothetical protein